MAKFLGVDIAKKVDKAFKRRKPPTVTLRKIVAGAVDPNNPTAGLPTSHVDYTPRALVASYAETDIDGTTVLKTDRSVAFFAASLPAGIAPSEGDAVLVEGRWTRILSIDSRDPAAAMYRAHVR